MRPAITRLSQMKRPKLLMKAARFALDGYDRKRALPRILGKTPTRHDHTIDELLLHEEQVESLRRSGGADYSPARHIELLTAIIAEARSLAAPDQV